MTLEEKYKGKTIEEKETALNQLKEEMPKTTIDMTEEELKAVEEKIRSNKAEIKYLKSSIKADKKNAYNAAFEEKYKYKTLEEKEAFDKEVEELRKIYTDPSKFKQAVYKKIQDAPDEETKQRWRGFLMNKPGYTTTGNTTTGNTTTGNTLTKESAWEIYNSKNGTANGLFESFNILGMTAEEARKEFLSKVPTPSDAAKKAFKEKYGVDLVVTDKDKDKDKNKDKNKNKNKNKDKDKDKDDDEDKYKNKYKSSMYGIIDAMKNGDIDPSTGIYFMLDALSKAARNTGIDIGNIGAQFSGGTVRNDYQDSLWSQRRNKMFENEMTSEINKQEGTDKEMEYKLAKEDLIGKGLSNEQADLALNASRTFNKKAEEFRKAGNDTMADLYALVGSAATKEVGPEELAAIAASNVLNTPEGKEAADEIIEALTGLVKTVGSTFGGINSILSFFDNLKNKWKK